MVDNCAEIEKKNKRLRGENQKLKEEIKRLLECVEGLNTAINHIIEFAKQVIEVSDGIMSGGGVPRGKWSYALGAKDTSEEAIRVIRPVDVRC